MGGLVEPASATICSPYGRPGPPTHDDRLDRVRKETHEGPTANDHAEAWFMTIEARPVPVGLQDVRD